jgi:hypothetical protein
MVPVATSSGVTIYCPIDGRYAFYNSPYPAHHLMSGIDIYPNPIINEPMPSPIDGEVLLVRYVKAPSGHGFEAPKFDVVTIIKSFIDPKRVIKILHVETKAKEGESVALGDPLGPLIRSGYFGYQTPLHAHVEVRPAGDPLRVRGGYPIDSLFDLNNLDLTEEITGVVTSSRLGYALIKLNLTTPGVVADIGGILGILDGGMPIYGWFGAHLKNPKKNTPVKLLGKNIGNVTDIRPRTCVADCTDFELMIESTHVDAFFIFLPGGEPTLAVTSRKLGELDLDVKSKVSLMVR